MILSVLLALTIDQILTGSAVLIPSLSIYLPLGGTAASQTGGLLTIAVAVGALIEYFRR
jgi:hypothetical protein